MSNDTTHQTTINEFLEVLTEEGFQKAMTLEHRIVPREDRGERKCDLHIWWHPTDYLMAVVEEYLLESGEDNILNSATIYFNMKPSYRHVFIVDGLTSGFLRGDIWAGEQPVIKDCRLKLKELREKGELIKWEYFPDVWVQHYLDKRENQKVLKEVALKLPQDIIDATNGFKDK